MKKLFLFTALFAAAAFLSCKHDDETLVWPEIRQLAITFAEGNSLEFNAGETKIVHYTITGGSDNTVVTAEMQTPDDAYTVETASTSSTEGIIAIITKMPETENCVIVTVSDGDRSITAEIAVSTNPITEELAITFAEGNSLQFDVDETKTVHYTITGGSANNVVKVEMQNPDGVYTVETTPTSLTEGIIKITAKVPTDNRVIVTVSDGSQTIMAAIDVTVIIRASFDGKTIVVETPGTLSQLLADYDRTTITELTVIGNLNSSDISTLKNLPNLAVLDMEHVNLKMLLRDAFRAKELLTSVKLPLTLKTIGESAFYGCSSLTSITIPDGVTTIEERAFLGCDSLTGVYITDIAKWYAIKFGDPFSNPLCYAHNLYLNGELVTELVIPNSVTAINDYAFYGCSSLTSVTIPDSVTSIGESVFFGCSSLTSVTIPDSVTTIGNNAFSGCSSLTNVTIGDGVTTIGDRAFFACSGLTSIYCKAQTPPAIESLTFSYWNKCTLYVPIGCKEAYAAAEYWKKAKKIIEMEF